MYVRVAVPLPVHGLFTYTAPQGLVPGAEVLVPFGKRRINGWVVDTLAVSDVPDARPIIDVIDATGAFDAEQLRFYRWISDYYLSPLGEVIACATPSGASVRTRHVYVPEDAGIEAIAQGDVKGDAGTVLREVVGHPGLSRTALSRRLHGEVDDVDKALDAAMRAGWLRGDDVIVEGAKDEESWARLVGDPAAAGLTERAVKAREVLATLVDGPKRVSELDAGALRRLERSGIVAREKRPRLDPWQVQPPRDVAPTLHAEQRAAVDAVGSVGVYLLHGVTGSGKTEVYLSLAARTLARGEQVLVLVPEIALTPQLVGRFAARFGDRIAVLHSGLTGAERLREWRRIREGRADVAVGARSGIFAPFRALGLVVVDEEHDDSYKQEEGVRYHARDLAIVRARAAGCPVVLGSATPSLESWENARTGRATLLRLRDRATPRPVPTLAIIDVRGSPKEQLIAPVIHDAIATALAEGGKAILLYNRRGYATFVECPGCGQSYDCPSCGIAMVYHQKVRRLDCHYCGFHRAFRADCPVCGSELEVLGRGTERVEEAVAAAFPGVPVSRMDADTTTARGSHARLLDDFREGRSQLLVGTQIVAKGHDFPDVHVAAVLGADHILGMPDFRSAERTFALVTQLCGRAGRGKVAGRVFLQTHHPDHPVFACIGDMDAFVAGEERVRRMLGYPPWSRLVLVRLEAVDRGAARQAAEDFAVRAREQARSSAGVDVLGPAVAPMARIAGRWRYQVILRGRAVAAFRRFLNEHHASWKTPSGVRRIVDVDPRSLA